LEIVQLWRCAACKRTFTPGPAALRNRTYPLRMILTALTDYDIGYTLEEAAARLKKKQIAAYHRRRSPRGSTSTSSTAATAASVLRACAATLLPRRSAPPSSTTGRSTATPTTGRSSTSCAGTLDDKRPGDARFAALADFLEAIPTTCPHDLFRREDNPKARASQATPTWAEASRIIINAKKNAATDTAALIIPAVGNNKLRHETLQRFMLCNDSVTVAIEIPIWLDEEDIAALEAEHGIELAPRVGASERAITGHIDFLQVRNGCVHILDYKPDARTNRPIAQLAIYALALTRRVPGLRLFDIKCAWFNEHEYCEMFPRTLFAKR
jgi:ATP-dependent exoDNAse (exonuclease V) beta subunit